jgi:hypothetical protein
MSGMEQAGLQDAYNKVLEFRDEAKKLMDIVNLVNKVLLKKEEKGVNYQ